MRSTFLEPLTPLRVRPEASRSQDQVLMCAIHVFEHWTSAAHYVYNAAEYTKEHIVCRS